MNQQLRRTRLHIALAVVLITSSLIGCDNEDEPKTNPIVTTSAITTVTTTTATGGGDITSDGNSAITESGLVYSSSNAMPTISDSKAIGSAKTGAFIVQLENLVSGKEYHIRAFATNSVGTGYGSVVEFMTGNAAPTVSDIVITGDLEVYKELTATYSYDDGENDTESGTTFQWYIADDESGVNETPISGATKLKYTPVIENEFKYVRIGITAKSSTGTAIGAEVKSAHLGPIAESTTVKFIYNGKEVTYGIITSAETGRKWMDRNLGAERVAINLQDHLAYGDLFQWGRGNDSHQLINWTQDILVGSSTPVNDAILIISSTDIPGHSNFIANNSTSPYDWHSPQNTNLWNAPDYTNNPCPSSWHIPSSQEWNDEKIDVINKNELKITAAGGRRGDNGALYDNSAGPGRQGWYWSSNSNTFASGSYFHYYTFTITASGEIFGNNFQFEGGDYGTSAYSCRCIQNKESTD